MIPQQGKWSDLQVGSYMRDLNGKTWKVIAERDFHLQIQDRDGVKKHLPPRPSSTPVTLMVATEAEAEKTLADVLGARAVARRDGEKGPWRTPAFPTSGAGAIIRGREHLSMMHGIWAGDVKTVAGLIECHTDSHSDPDPHGYQEHVHP